MDMALAGICVGWLAHVVYRAWLDAGSRVVEAESEDG